MCDDIEIIKRCCFKKKISNLLRSVFNTVMELLVFNAIQLKPGKKELVFNFNNRIGTECRIGSAKSRLVVPA